MIVPISNSFRYHYFCGIACANCSITASSYVSAYDNFEKLSLQQIVLYVVFRECSPLRLRVESLG